MKKIEIYECSVSEALDIADEAITLAKLNHPNIIKYFDSFHCIFLIKFEKIFLTFFKSSFCLSSLEDLKLKSLTNHELDKFFHTKTFPI